MRTSPIILSVDTSTQKIGVAVYDGLHVICEYIWESKDHHTVELAPAVVEILSRSNLKMFQMGALAVALGPGSFTGLRIGLAFAKGLSFPRRLPIIGISTFDILVSAQKEENLPVIAILQAGRNRLAVGWYNKIGQIPAAFIHQRGMGYFHNVQALRPAPGACAG